MCVYIKCTPAVATLKFRIQTQYYVIVLSQTTPSQTPVEGSLQSELLSSPQTPPPDHIAPPPSTVDTAALNEDPEPGEDIVFLQPYFIIRG